MNTGEIYDIFCNGMLPKGNCGYTSEDIRAKVKELLGKRTFSNLAFPHLKQRNDSHLVMQELMKLKNSHT